MSFMSSLSSRLKALGLVGALLAVAVAFGLAEFIASRLEAPPPVETGIEARPAPAAHRQPNTSDVPRDVGMNPVARTEEEFDRKFGMCRRC